MKIVIFLAILLIVSGCKDSSSSIELPVSPADLMINYADSAEISISWSDKSENEEGFKIYRREKNEIKYAQVGVLPENEFSFIDSSADYGAYYYYQVSSYNSHGESSRSNLVSAFAERPALHLLPESSTISLFNTATITLKFTNCYLPVHGLSFRLQYNPDVLAFSDSSGFELLDFFGSDVLSFNHSEDSNIYVAISLKNGQQATQGSSNICTFTLAGISIGASHLEISDSDVFIIDSDGKQIIYQNLILNFAEIIIQ